MKRTIILLAMLFFTMGAFAQRIDQNNVPAVILNAFQIKFPNAQGAKWKVDKGDYEIDFKVNNKSHELKMDYKGRVLQHSQDLYVSEIPKVVLESIRDKVTYFDVHDADKYERGSRITYEIKFKIDGKYHFFWVSENGKLLKYRKELKDSELPDFIKGAIKNNYGEIDIDYSKYVEEGKRAIYIVRGEINDYDHNFTFDDKAKLLKHSQDLRDSEIPKAILNTLSSNYKDYDIRDADLIEEKGKKIYVLKIRKSKSQIHVIFSPNGKVLREK